MMGIGRFGGIAGSFLVAELAGMSMPATFAVVAVPAVVAALAVIVKLFARRAALRAGPGAAPALGH